MPVAHTEAGLGGLATARTGRRRRRWTRQEVAAARVEQEVVRAGETKRQSLELHEAPRWSHPPES